MKRLRLRDLASWWPLLLVLLTRELNPCSCVNEEGRALLRFRERVEVDPYAVLSDWVAGGDTDVPYCFSIECVNGKVVALWVSCSLRFYLCNCKNLKDHCLKGTLSPELGKLIHLKSLVLLKNLEILNLGCNDLCGPIPSDLENILSLEFLNQFQGNMLSELYDLRMHSELKVDGDTPSSNERSITRNHGNVTIRRLLRLKKTEKSGQKSRKKRFPGPSPAPSPSFLPPSPLPSPLSPYAPSPLTIIPSPGPSPAISTPSSPTFRDPPSQDLSPSTSLTSPRSSPDHDHTLPPSPMLENPHSPVGSHTVNTPTFPIPSPTPSGSPSIKYSHVKKHTVMLVGGVGGFGLVALLIICIHCYRGKKLVTVKPWTTGLSGQLQKAFVTGVPQLKRSELETACEDFSNIIGSLSDCILYKGTLSSGVEIAVASTFTTSAKNWSKHSEAQFRTKIATLSKVNHKNFVNLLGYCKEEDPFTRMMVFEYAPNGTLFEHLHVKEAEDLDWAARLRIGMGIAYCLDHMHQVKAPVILRNLKSSSIYLTDDFAAKIADLEFSSEPTIVVSASENSGPLDKQTPSLESIVYEFGIVLLEIISGRLPYSEENGSLLDWASDYLRGLKHVGDIVDPTLKTFCHEDIRAICEVIRRCCNPEPQERPTMKEVAGQLRDITAVPPDGATPKLSPLWWAELEILSSEAN
uniref:Putative LRR receptor-like serine/threonine-protein kinase MRH1 n=1 Tax=Anthurium amnicola TaxID=1678845 RepID=A0A1D1ZGT3_9ARAE